MHCGKTKILGTRSLRTGVNTAKQVEVAGHNLVVLQVPESVSYLGRRLCFQEFADRELEHRIPRAWAKFSTFRGELCDKRYSLVHRIGSLTSESLTFLLRRAMTQYDCAYLSSSA